MARQIELTTPLGKDVLLFRAMHAREELGRLSEFDLSALSTRSDIASAEILSKNVTVKLELTSGGFRYFNGYVTRFSQGGMVGRYYQYRMIVRSWLWFATRTADCRIFQEKTVPDIIKEVFADHPVAVFEDGLTGKYSKRTYCVQYRETDFNFVSRLMEEEGIYYYFDHQDSRHVLKLVDSNSTHKALEHKATIAYYPPGKEIRADEEFIHACTFAQNIKPGNVAHTDFDFTKPKADLTTKAKLIAKHERADYEIFDYPGEYAQSDDGDRYARARVDELHSEFDRGELECNVREIAVGRTFTFSNAPRRDQEHEYLIVGAQYQLEDNAYESSSDEGASYHCQFTVQQRRQQFRPARITPVPKVSGPQTAMVVGAGGEEIWTDKYGRVKVQFHWDRYGKKDENSSCWIRVSNPWAGGNWGGMAIPRIGQEVVVDFLEGDPDQPIITGRVYNADQMPPYDLPASKTQTGIKSRSSPGGGAANFNEIRLEDKKGSEQLFLHAEKNQDIEVEKDETHWVGQDRKKTIDRDETTHVKHDRTETVDNNETITIHGNRTEVVDKDETITIHQNRTETVDKDERISIHGGRTETVDKDEGITIHGGRTKTVDKDETISVGGTRSAKITGDDTVQIGKSLTINATDTITIKVGSASITMQKDGTVQIKGKDITVNGSGDIVGKASGNMTLKGQKILQN